MAKLFCSACTVKISSRKPPHSCMKKQTNKQKKRIPVSSYISYLYNDTRIIFFKYLSLHLSWNHLLRHQHNYNFSQHQASLHHLLWHHFTWHRDNYISFGIRLFLVLKCPLIIKRTICLLFQPIQTRLGRLFSPVVLNLTRKNWK